jgi:hypothetical protein
MKLVRLSALRTGRLYPPPPRRYSWDSVRVEAEGTPGGARAAGRIRSMKNFNDTVLLRKYNIIYGACALRAGYLGYKHTFRICNTYCFSTVNNDCKKAPKCFVICTSRVFLNDVSYRETISVGK